MQGLRLKVEFYQDKAGKHRWRIKASNGRILADSGQGYRAFGHCQDGFYSVMIGIGDRRFRMVRLRRAKGSTGVREEVLNA